MSDLVQTPSFRLAHLSDLHFSNLCWNPMQFTSKRWIGNANLLLRRMHEFRHDKVYQLAEYFKEIQVKYLLVSGDLSTTSQNCEFEQAVAFVKSMQAVDIEVITLPGNHDHYTKKDYKKHTFYNFFSSYFCQPDSPFAKYNLRDHKVAVKNLGLGYWLVTLDTALATPLLACHGHFSRLIESTLQEVLSLIPADDKVIMANHFPLFTCDSKSKHLQGDNRLRNLLHQFPIVKLYLHGHTHRHCIADLRNAGLPILLDSGCASHKKTGSWNLLDCSKDSCTVKPHYWSESIQSRGTWAQKKATLFTLT
ncbi:MAG: metallophosphoesterase [Chlamydiae bacterium]|nr:metallophosphoesterase [Chlamydiota bacterium]